MFGVGRPFFVRAVLLLAATYLALRFALPDTTEIRRVLYALLLLPAVVPLSSLFLQWSGSFWRRLAVRLAVRRARLTFRSALRAAARHPELADVDRLRDAALVLSRYVTEASSLPEVAEAASHPYKPIQSAALRVLQAAAIPGVIPKEERTS